MRTRFFITAALLGAFAPAALAQDPPTLPSPTSPVEIGRAANSGKWFGTVDFGALPVRSLGADQAARDRLASELRSFLDTPGALSPIDLFTGGLAVAGQPLVLRRIAGFVLDFLILAPVLGALVALQAVLLPESTYLESAVGFAPLVYFVVVSVTLATSPGQRIAGLKVTRLDRSPPSLKSGWFGPSISPASQKDRFKRCCASRGRAPKTSAPSPWLDRRWPTCERRLAFCSKSRRPLRASLSGASRCTSACVLRRRWSPQRSG